MNSRPVTRRRFLASAGASAALAALPLGAAEARLTRRLVDCPRHWFFPEVLDLMRRRQTEPLALRPRRGIGRPQPAAPGQTDDHGPSQGLRTDASLILSDNARHLFQL